MEKRRNSEDRRGPSTDDIESPFGSTRGSVIAPEGFGFMAPVLDEPPTAAEGELHE